LGETKRPIRRRKIRRESTPYRAGEKRAHRRKFKGDKRDYESLKRKASGTTLDLKIQNCGTKVEHSEEPNLSEPPAHAGKYQNKLPFRGQAGCVGRSGASEMKKKKKQRFRTGGIWGKTTRSSQRKKGVGTVGRRRSTHQRDCKKK